MSLFVKENVKLGLPILLMIVFALSRWPGLMPPNFSAVYGLVFCAAVYFPRRMAWWLPLTTLVVSDLAINCYYYFSDGINAFQFFQLMNYAVYGALIWFGQRFNKRSSFVSLLAGGLMGAIFFYIVTNTASWFFNPFGNPEYSKTFAGWILALTKGTAGWPHTWELFRNTFLSGGLFTGLFVGAMKLSEASEETEEEENSESEPDEIAPEESTA